jgi:hypothetical protein
VNALEIARKESVTTSKFFDGLANDKGTMPAYEGLVLVFFLWVNIKNIYF